MSTPHLCALGAAALLLSFQGGCLYRTPADYQREQARTLRPSAVDAVPVVPADMQPPKRLYRVRAYADPDYRAQVLHWPRRITAQIERAGRILEAQLGARIEVESVRPWARAKPPEDLTPALEDLAALDPGRDVDWVVGFVSALETFAVQHDQLGMAMLGGRHIVLRAMASYAEMEQLTRAFDQVPRAELEDLARERQLHKETAVLLHELAHTLGAGHDTSTQWLMAPAYEPGQSAFSRESIRQIVEGLRSREVAAARHDTPPAAGAAAPAPANVLDRARAALPPDEARVLDEAARYARERRLDRAWELLAPLAARRLEDPAVQELACELSSWRAPRARQSLDICRTAAQLEGAGPAAPLLLGQALLARDRFREAVAALESAETKLGVSTDARAWLRLAQLYDRARTCTGAERAAGRAGAGALSQGVVDECTRQRRAVALPRGGRGVPEAREHEYVTAVMAAQRQILMGEADAARAQARFLARSFPDAAGAPLVECLAAAHGGPPQIAKRSCAEAERADPEAFSPHRLLGRIAMEEERWALARGELRRALDLDDTAPDVWRDLATVHDRLGETDELDRLRSRYRSRFGEELPPGARAAAR